MCWVGLGSQIQLKRNERTQQRAEIQSNDYQTNRLDEFRATIEIRNITIQKLVMLITSLYQNHHRQQTFDQTSQKQPNQENNSQLI